MTDTAWVALAALGVTVIIAIIGAGIGAVKATWNLQAWLGEQLAAVKKSVGDSLDGHEFKDQGRHEENIARFATIETTLGIIARNGHDKAKKVRSTTAL